MYNLSKWGKRLAKLIAAAGKETRARGSLWQARAQAPPSPGRPPLAESHGRGPRAPGQPLLRTKETACMLDGGVAIATQLVVCVFATKSRIQTVTPTRSRIYK